MNSFSISGEGPEWHVFRRRSKDERPVIEDIKIYFRHNARAISGI